MVRRLRAPRETYGAWSLMLLEGVRTLDEAVEEVREERARQEQEAMRRRGHERLERARIKAINRQHRIWNRGGSKYELSSPAAAGAQSGAEPAIEPEKAELPARSRPALSPVREETARTTIDLTAEDDTMALPKLDSLERKLADLERQYG